MALATEKNNRAQGGNGSHSESLDEAKLWQVHGANWRQLYGSFRDLGVSFEWHELRTQERLDWSKSFHPHSLEVCLNLAGHATVALGKQVLSLPDKSVGFFYQGATPLKALREKGQRHQFISLEFSPQFLQRHLSRHAEGLTPWVRALVENTSDASFIAPAQRLNSAQLEVARSLQKPPVYSLAQPAWYLGKALEFCAALFYQPPPEAELFCHRQHHVAAERVERVMALLREHLSEPLTLEEIGRRVGCSPFYLSRTFSRETGMTLPQYLRQLRMEKAAALLRTGKYNVTEAALEVGYNSLSHFSHAFHQTFGCCPGLYPAVRPPAGQKKEAGFGFTHRTFTTTKTRLSSSSEEIEN